MVLNGFKLSPDDRRILTMVVGNDGLVIKWFRADGAGEVHDVARTAVACVPGWSSNRTVWVAQRRGVRIEWQELDIETGRQTGRVSPGSSDCTDGGEDPLSPVPERAKVIVRHTFELRLLPASHLKSG
jgi:hypothetical protein